MNKSSTDAELVQYYLSGNQKAFEILLKRYERPLYSFIFRFVRERESADDLFQQTWFKVIRNINSYNEQGKFGSWLFGIANNCCIDLIRKSKSDKRDDYVSDEGLDNLPNADDDPVHSLQKKEKNQWLESAVQQLPVEQQQVVLLRVYADLSFKEIAELLNCSLNTVLGRMHYATNNLRKMSIETFGEEE